MARRRLTPVIDVPRAEHPGTGRDVPHAEHRETGRDVPRAEHLAGSAPREGNVPRAEHPSFHPGPLPYETKAFAARPANPPPIARVAAEAAETAALEEVAGALRHARETGRLVLDLPLDAIAPDHLTRDRLPAEDEEMAALRESLRLHGQRTPVEVTPLATDSGLAWGLISGWRRLTALKALHAETGDPRFATIQALARRPDTLAAAYVGMVEENEIRVGLSPYERARVAALATRRGVFDSEKKALLTLFGTASRAKRSRIRAFLDVFHALDSALRFPAHLPERLGLQLSEAVRAGQGGRIAAALAAADPPDPEAERMALEQALRPERPAPAAGDAEPLALAPGLTLRERLKGRRLVLTLTGEAVTPALAARLRRLLTEMPAEE